MSSTLNSGLAFGRRLETAGHRVVFLSSTNVSRAVEEAGFEFVHLNRDLEFEEASAAASSHGQRKEIRRQSIENTQVEETVESLGADLLIIDIEMHFAVIATAHLRLPTILPIVWFSIDHSWSNPPLNTSLGPPRGLGERVTVIRAWLKNWTRFRRAQILRDVRRILRRDSAGPVRYQTLELSDLRALARSRGWSMRKGATTRAWLRPLMYKTLDVVSFNLEELDFPNAAGPKTTYVGPMVLTDRVEPQPAVAAKESLAAFVESSGEQSTRPLIYCSLGSFVDTDEELLARVVDVFRRRQEWDLVLGLGGKLEASVFDELPENVLALDWAPQVDVLEMADCAITHGGITTINECIVVGVPMVFYSTGHGDQDGSVARLVHHGLGVEGDRSNDSSLEIERNIERVLTDKRFANRVVEMRRLADVYRLDRRAESVVERLLSGVDV